MGSQARHRDGLFAAGLCAAIVVLNAVIALSDRMASLWSSTSTDINAASDVVSEVVASTGVTRSQGDWAAHSVLWGVSAVLVVLLVARRRHVVLGLTVFAGAGLALEVLQNMLATERSAELRDVAGNIAGLACGALVGLAARSVVRGAQAPERGPRM